MPIRPWVVSATPDILMEDGDKPEVPGWDLTAIWTPGHSPGHLCFYEAGHRLMLSGDHVLPRITPNISFHPQAGPDPLGDFLSSLDKVGGLRRVRGPAGPRAPIRRPAGPGPGPEEPSPGPIRRDPAAIRAGDTTTWAIAGHMTWSRPWDEITGWMRRAATGETLAHLRHLEKLGVLREDIGEPSHWQLVDTATRA